MSVKTERHRGLAVIRLDAPSRGNALSPEMVLDAGRAFEDASNDPAVHTVAFCGEGRHFCTGFDLSDLDRLDDGALLWRFVAIEQLLQRVWLAPVRTAAIAHGSTFGAGADLFAACDERWVLYGTRFRFPGAGFGLVLGTRRLAERVGSDRARRWVGFGQTVGTAEALACGFANGQVADPAARPAAAHGEDPDGPPVGAAVGDPDWRASLAQTPAVGRETLAALHRASRADLADADLAALVRSAARPGLRARIEAYRAQVAAARAR